MLSDASTERGTEPGEDLSTIAWVQDELRRSLDTAHKALRRHLREAEAAKDSDVDAVDPGVLRAARQAFHQSAGALELVGLPAAAVLLRASEAAVQRLGQPANGLTVTAVETIERASFALIDLIQRMLAGKPTSPLALFPQYKAVAELAALDRIHPADLSPTPWSWRDLGREPGVTPRPANEDSRMRFEHQLLQTLRAEPRRAFGRMGDLCAELAAGADSAQAAHLWKLAAAFFEATACGLLTPDVYSKRVGSRLLAQLRSIERGDASVSQRLAQDLLFFCGQSASPGDGRVAPRLAAVRQAYGLQRLLPVAYAASTLGRFDPAWISQARKRVASAKEGWSALAAGDALRSAGLAEKFLLVGDSLRRLYPGGKSLAEALQQACGASVASGAAPTPALAMEVATSLLYLEASLEDGDLDDAQMGTRIARLAERVAQVAEGQEPQPLEAWMEDLYRRVSDRQTMGSVVQELRASLAEAEKSIDDFFRDPSRPEVLASVPPKLATMRGVLSVLGIDAADQALEPMRDEVERLARAPTSEAHEEVFDRLAANLGALGFLIDMLSVQPELAKTLFVYDAASRVLQPLMGRLVRERAPAPAAVDAQLIEQAQAIAYSAGRPDVPLDEVSRDLDRLAQQAQIADSAGLAETVSLARSVLAEARDAEAGGEASSETRERLSGVLADFVSSAASPFDALAPEPAVATGRAAGAPVRAADEESEMREIFLEEAREVIGEAEAAQLQLVYAPTDLSLLTAIRRGFHTLKGSSRMVGLREFGEAAWACEQVYNTRLAGQQPADDALMEFTGLALGRLSDWIEAIARGDEQGRSAAELQQAAARFGVTAPAMAAPAVAARPTPAAAIVPAPTVAVELAPTAAQGLPAVEAIAPAPEVAPQEADLSAAGGPGAAPPLEWPPGLPSAADLELTPPEAAPAAPAPVPPQGLDFPLLVDQVEPLEAQAPVPHTPEADLVPVLALEEAVDAGAPVEMPSAPAEVGEAMVPVAAAAESVELDLGPWDDAAVPPPALVPPPLDSVVDELELLLEPGAIDRSLPALAPSAAPAATEPPVEVEPQVEALTREAAGGTEVELPEPIEPIEPIETAQGATTGGPPGGAAPVPEDVKVIGPLRVSIPLFNIYLNEADELSRRLTTEVAEWAMESHRPVGDAAVALAHSLGGSSATIGFVALSQLARRFETVLARANEVGYGLPDEGRLYVEVAEEIRRLLHQFAAGFLHDPAPALLDRLAGHERDMAERSRARDLQRQAGATQAAPLSSEVTEPPWVPAADVFELPATAAAVEPPTDLAQPWAAPETPVTAAAAEPPVEITEAPLEVVELPSPAAEPVGEVPVESAERPGPSAPAVATASEAGAVVGDDEDIDAVDLVDPELFPVFEEEAGELLPQLDSRLRDWIRQPADLSAANACLRTLHTLKGGARLAGAMRLGEMAHRMESRIEQLLAFPPVRLAAIEALQTRSDALTHALDALRRRDARAYEDASLAIEQRLAEAALEGPAAVSAAPAPAPAPAAAPAEPLPVPEVAVEAEPAPLAAAADETARPPEEPQTAAALGVPLGAEPVAEPAAAVPAEPVSASPAEASPPAAAEVEAAADAGQRPAPLPVLPVLDVPGLELPAPPGARGDSAPPGLPEVDWGRFMPSRVAAAPETVADDRAAGPGSSAVRVRTPVLERMVGLSGEVSVRRSRIEAGVHQIRASLGDLTENLSRMREQLRDIELQAEMQMASRREAARAAAQPFDPLEFDRFTRFQELTRMMAESVNDVATVHRNLQRAVETAEDELAAQARLTRELQDDLLRTRMVEFDTLSDRLYRVVRQAAKETGKQVRLDILGGSIEVDRGVLDRMTPAFEHLLRNAVTHGIEPEWQRAAAGKPPAGLVVVALTQEGNDVSIEFRDDGGGLDLARIREKGIAMGLLGANVEYADADLAQLIFTPGFSTAGSVTELAGRGIGMDVVRAEVNAMGGRIETATAAGQGTSFRLVLPLTTAVTQVVMLRCGDSNVAVPATLVEMVRRATADELDRAYASGQYALGETGLPFFWLGALLHLSPCSSERGGRTRPLVIIRSAQQRVALHVDEVLGTQEVVVKNLGPQLARLPGLAGMTVLASGAIALIYNPVALASAYGEAAHAAMVAAAQGEPTAPEARLPMPGGLPAAQPQPLVLVVDDSLTVRRVTQRLLVREGYRVALAKDGLEALERLAEERPAVVLSDIEMPRMDGFDLVRNIRSDVRLRSLPVIMITSRIAQKHRDYAAELGVDHYLGKPYAEEELLALVNRYAHATVSAPASRPVPL